MSPFFWRGGFLCAHGIVNLSGLSVSLSLFFFAQLRIAFLPSSFTLYTNTLAFAYALAPPSSEDSRRTLVATLLFASGAIVGWPFALAIAIPFVLEELLVRGIDRVQSGKAQAWFVARVTRLVGAGLCASLIFVRLNYI